MRRKRRVGQGREGGGRGGEVGKGGSQSWVGKRAAEEREGGSDRKCGGGEADEEKEGG